MKREFRWTLSCILIIALLQLNTIHFGVAVLIFTLAGNMKIV